MKLTRAGVALASAGFSLFGLGLSMGNLDLLLLGTFPLILLAAALAMRVAAAPAAARDVSTPSPRRGEAFGMALRIAPPAGGALLEAHAPLPDSFELEQGTNLVLLARAQPRSVAMRLRAHARGKHVLAPVEAEIIDPAGLAAPQRATLAPSVTIDVAPRRYNIQRTRARSARLESSTVAEEDEARLGVDSTDFRELRDYAWGDPPNAINWKATARRLSSLGRRGGGHAAPVVNEYEKEGRRTVLVLLDGGEPMRVGTTLETGLDHGVEGALAAAKYFLARGARVGAWTFGSASGPLAPPESGSSQVSGIERALSPGEPDPDLSLPLALRGLQPHLAGAKPFVIVITRVTPANADELVEAARRIRVLLAERRRLLPLLVVDVRALDLAPAPSPGWAAARVLVEHDDRASARRVAETGARVVTWRPGQEDFRKALLRGGLA